MGENNNTSIETKTMPAENENLNEKPGFEAVFAMAGLIAVAYLVRRK
ncbi:MAG: PGF-CTERM sorting domain-containing protein [Candidatus Andersenbacteria bacterium]|nr:PGF-CTERM sorting domain-containing protein [Candidatus Andersenbacteria bacterium]